MAYGRRYGSSRRRLGMRGRRRGFRRGFSFRPRVRRRRGYRPRRRGVRRVMLVGNRM